MRHLFVHLPSFPRPAPDFVIDYALAIASRLGARLSASIVTIIQPRPNPTRARYLDLLEIMETQERVSINNAHHLRATLTKRMQHANVTGEIEDVGSFADGVPDLLVERMRASDLAITPFADTDDAQPRLLEAMIFDGGRPLLVVPREPARITPPSTIVVAWDQGRAAARALGDAMALLEMAKHVHVLSVDEPSKPEAVKAGGRLARHFSAHGIEARNDSIASDMQKIGERLMDHARGLDADLLVMGAFGHGRVRGFLLGSATRGVLAGPRLPVLLSH